MEITTRNWKSTLRENENIAKEAVFISIPRRLMTHCCGFADEMSTDEEGFTVWMGETHGSVRSGRRTPFSRASCSRVMGMNEPVNLLFMVD